MGQDCCTNRLKTEILSTSSHNNDTASAFMQTTFNPFKKSLSISFLYLLTGKQINQQANQKIILELAEQCSKNHICCYFDPDYLQKHHSLIEYQSPGSLFSRHNLAQVFWADLDYFYQEGICNEILKFKVILLIETQGKSRHALTIIRCMDSLSSNYFIVYDHLNMSKQYREKRFQDESQLDKYLNTKGEDFFVSYSQMSLSIKLLTFEQIEDKTESDIENIVNNHNLMQTNNQINTHPSFHSLLSHQQQMNSKSNASIQQQQQQKLPENQIPLSIQLQNIPSNERNNRKSDSSISSKDGIRSFQSLNQLTFTSRTKQQRNSSLSAPSEKSETYILRQPHDKHRQILTKFQKSDQITNKQFLSQLKQMNQNWLEIKNDNYTKNQVQSLKLKNQNNLLISPQMNTIQNNGHQLNFSSNNTCQKNQQNGNLINMNICLNRDMDNYAQINLQNQNIKSQDNQNGQQQEMIDYSNSYFSSAENYNQNNKNENNFAEYFEILEKNKNSQASLQKEEEGEADANCSFNLCGQNAANHCDNEQEDFLSDDASDIQICIQSASILQ